MSKQEVHPEEIINQMRSIDALEFEELIADLWEVLGYNTEVTQSSSDRGVDVIATREFPYEEKNLIQAKRYSSTISGPELREYIALARRDAVDSVIVVSTSGFTSQAKQEADEYNIKLINGHTLANLLIQEDAVDLVREYIGEIKSAGIEQKRSPDGKSDSSQEFLTTVGEGEYTQIEIVGYSYEKAQIWGTETEEELMMVFLEVMNKSDGEWRFKPKDDLSVASTEGYSYSDVLPSFGDIGPWTTGSVDIKRDSKARVALIYDTGMPIVPEKIEYSARVYLSRRDVGPDDEMADEIEEITVPVDESIREDINSVPDSFRPKMADVIMTSHPDFNK